MKIILFLCICFLAYFIIGGIYTCIFVWDAILDVMDNHPNVNIYKKYICVIKTIILYTPYNIKTDIKNLVKRHK